ncbi:hypothetical protein [Brachybacterium fresconis]|uniref:Uncharacterized protein n=1 Tax=Brachybacterium fresconis TaxID=173363 RepID=A0ABS4YN01_9MICO|nr:hypothetical protein [Brachybacterium fresconis]MBP2409303.1 hypothetical protein [Brachybacterium fresconis]
MTRTRRMPRARSTAAGALLAALALTLGACSLLPGRGAPDLAASDVITLHITSAGMFGYFGGATTEIDADTISMRYRLPNDAVIYDLTEELEAGDRERIEEAAEKYVAWEKTLSEKERTPCTDIPSTGVEISGSVTHDSSVQDCGDDTPLRDLRQRVDDAEPEPAEHLAHPLDDWTIEIRPWAEDGPDESAPVERYVLTKAQHEIGMGISAENTPDGWGAGLAPGDDEDGDGTGSAPLGWDATGAVLTEINDYLLGRDQLGCGDQTGEIRVIKQGDPSQTWTYRLCPGQQSEVLAETLRSL